MASLTITSIPNDALVYVDNNYAGHTPINRYQTDPGNCEINIRKSGYKDFTTSIFANPEQVAFVDTRLLPLLTNATISSNPQGALIWIDDQLIPEKQTPARLDSLPIGDHIIRLQKSGYREFETSLVLKENTTNNISAELEVSRGKVEISVKPWGSIYIDEQLMKKETNVKYTTTLPTGKHKIRIQHPLFGEWQKEIDLQDNQHQYIPVNFNDLVNIRVAAFDANGKPVWAEIVVDNQLTGELTPKEIAVRIGQRTIAAKKDGYILVNGEKTVMLEKNLDEPIKFIFKKVL